MVIYKRDIDTVREAARLVLTNPHPVHMEEFWLVNGFKESIVNMVDHSFKGSALAAGAVKGDRAIIAGVRMNGIVVHEIWMLTTANAPQRPAWIRREAGGMLAWADDWMKWPHGYAQYIPDTYHQGIRFAERMGFTEEGREPSPANRGVSLVKMQRMVPKKETVWVQP